MAKANALTMATVDYLLGLPGPFSSTEDLDAALAGIRQAIAACDWDAVPAVLKVGGKPDARVAACFAHSIPLHGCVSWPEELAGLITPAEED